MSLGVLALILAFGVVALTPLADRVRVPQPVLLTLFGLAVAFLPFTPDLDSLDPRLVLPVVLPPLLFAATQRTTVQEFRSHARSVLVLAVGLTVATMAVAAVIGHALGLGWSSAWVLGAIVSPPDPVAATAVARRLRLPHRLVTLLEGEGMFNDAAALVAYKVAVAATVTGNVSAGGTLLNLVLALVVGTLLGLALGWLTRLALSVLDQAYAETTVTILVPFVAYVGAERLDGSGVLAVLTLGLFLRTYGHRATTSRGWLLGRSVWSYVDFMVGSMVFAFVGFELVKGLANNRHTIDTLWFAVGVVGAVIVFRGLWVFPGAWLARFHARQRDNPIPIGWRESALVSWAGMRGVVTVATALALPFSVDGGGDFPRRPAIQVVALVCVLVTLVLQGLTLSPLVRLLRVGGSEEDPEAVFRLRDRAARAALQVVEQAPHDQFIEEVRRAAATQWEGYLSAQQTLAHARSVDTDEGDAADQLRELLDRATDAERELVLAARRRGEVSAAVADEVLHDVEARAVRDFS